MKKIIGFLCVILSSALLSSCAGRSGDQDSGGDTSARQITDLVL